MQLTSYLKRIGVTREVRPDFATLKVLHRAHQLAVPFENLDVQLNRPLTIDVDAAFDKIVNRRRGGWCYEMNGVFGWALEQIGFDVMRLCAGVMRERAGDRQLGNHLCLLVRLDRAYLVDVGFGGSLLEPIPLEEHSRVDAPYFLELKRSGLYWRFSERALPELNGDAFSFDVVDVAADEALLAKKCQRLQVDADSPFVLNLIVQRRTADAHRSLRGRVLTTIRTTGIEKRLLGSPAELMSLLKEAFDLEVPEAQGLWPRICARHAELALN